MTFSPPPPICPASVQHEQEINEQLLAAPLQRPLMRAWTYPRPAVVLGRAQSRLALPEDPAGDALPVIVRGAGGAAVLTGPWLLSLALALPPDDSRIAGLSVENSYRWLGQALTAALQAHGLPARACPPGQRQPAPAHLAWACFAGVGAWEIVVPGEAAEAAEASETGEAAEIGGAARTGENGGIRGISETGETGGTGAADTAPPGSGSAPRKVIGLAQRRSRHGVLFVAGVLLTPSPWQRLCQRMGLPPDQAAAQAAQLAACTADIATLRARQGQPPLSAEALMHTLWPLLQPMQAEG